MTIKQLKKRLEQIPPVGAINKARRAAIISLINQKTMEKARRA